jgi:hypothetical protein
MHTVTAFHGSEFGRDQLRAILRDSVELERLRIVRRVRVRRYGLLTFAAMAMAFAQISMLTLALIAVAGLLAPAFACLDEIRCEWRLAGRLDRRKS